MSAPDQLSMFEPHGTELARLAQSHLVAANTLAAKAVLLSSRNLLAAGCAFAAESRDALAQAEVCELALLFETLAGLQ